MSTPLTKHSYEEREVRLEQIKRQAQLPQTSLELFRRETPRASAETGYYEQPLLKAPQWNLAVPLYLFVGGAAGASSVIAAISRLSGTNRALTRDARKLASLGGMISPALLIADLGVPTRFLNMLRVFKPQSPMSIGSWCLGAFTTASLTAELLPHFLPGKLHGLLAVSQTASALFGLVLSTYTGVLVGATAIPIWNEHVAMLPVHFAASGAGTAASILELVGHRSPALNRIATGAPAVETVVGASIEIRRSRSTEPLRRGSSGWMMRAAGLLSGPIPLALRLIAGNSHWRRKLRRAAAISSIAGSALTRWAWVQAGRASARDFKTLLQIEELKKFGTAQA